jgi:predicted nucleic acid-binding protein
VERGVILPYEAVHFWCLKFGQAHANQLRRRRTRLGDKWQLMDRATAIRAQYGFKTPDAIHLAAAVPSGCDVFLTNDHRLDRFPDITIEIVRP